MHAIRINEENLETISQTPDLTPKDLAAIEELYLKRHYYFITGYTTIGGRYVDWTILPWFSLIGFDLGPTTYVDLQKDWVHIVRK